MEGSFLIVSSLFIVESLVRYVDLLRSMWIKADSQGGIWMEERKGYVQWVLCQIERKASVLLHRHWILSPCDLSVKFCSVPYKLEISLCIYIHVCIFSCDCVIQRVCETIHVCNTASVPSCAWTADVHLRFAAAIKNECISLKLPTAVLTSVNHTGNLNVTHCFFLVCVCVCVNEEYWYLNSISFCGCIFLEFMFT